MRAWKLMMVTGIACIAASCGNDDPHISIGAAETNNQTLRAIGDSRVVTPLPPAPGLPEGIVARGLRIYVATPAGFDWTDDAIVYVHNKFTGREIAQINIPPKYPGAPNPLSGLAPGWFGDMYVLNPLQRGVVRFNDYLDAWEDYTPNGFPDLPPCAVDPSGPCSPTMPICDPFWEAGMPCTPDMGRPPLVNSLAFGPDGELYVTDTFQATIWRVPFGGGDPEIWFQSELLEDVFGANGIRVNPLDHHVYVIVTGLSTPFGHIYRLPLASAPSEEDLELFHVFSQGEGPDELTFALSGNMYVSNATANTIAKISPSGELLATYHGPSGGEIVMRNPSGLDFDGVRLVISNHASMPPMPENYAILDLVVGEIGMPYYRPLLPW